MTAMARALILLLAWSGGGSEEPRQEEKSKAREEPVENGAGEDEAGEDETGEEWSLTLVPPAEEEEGEEGGAGFTMLESVPSSYALFGVTESGSLHRWDMLQLTELFQVRPFVGPVIGLCRSLDGRSLLFADRLSSIAVLDSATGETTRKINWMQAQPITRLAWDSREGSIYAGTARSLVRFHPDTPGSEVSIDLASNVGPVALDPLHGLFVAGIEGAMLAVARTQPFELVERLGGHESDVSVLAFNNTGELLASGSSSGEVLIWQFEQRRVMRVVRIAGAPIVSLAFDLRTDLLAVGTERGDLIVLEPRSGKQFAALPTETEEPIEALVFCDAAVLSSADRERGLRVWQVLRFIDKEHVSEIARRAKAGEKPREKSRERAPEEAGKDAPKKGRKKERSEKPEAPEKPE
jgi:WD40 repeat protein